MAQVISDLGLISRIDARIVPDAPEEITPGEAVAGMILKGLGCAKRPRSLTPQVFATTPLDRLFRAGIRAEMCKRFTLGRTLDEVHTDGCDLLWSERALPVCLQAGRAPRFPQLDTTSFARTGDDVPESAAQAIRLTPGYATDHRPDWKPAVLAWRVSQEGGVPLVRNSWDGHASETQSFQARAQALLTAWAPSPPLRDLVAEATLYTEDTAATLATLGLITRLPGTLQLVLPGISPARQGDTWHELDDTTRSQGLEWCHDGMAQRWLVVASQAARERAEASVTTAQPRAWEAIEKPRLHVHAQRFERPEAAHAALAALANSGRSHQVESCRVLAHQH